MSVTKMNERESEQTKSERAENKNERESEQTENERAQNQQNKNE